MTKDSYEYAKEERDSNRIRASTVGNQTEILFHSKKDIEKFLNIEDNNIIERRHSFTLLNEEPNNSLILTEMKESNFALMKDIYEINSNTDSSMFESINSRKITENFNTESMDGKITMNSAKSLTNIPKNEFLFNNNEQQPEQKNLMKDKFVDVDKKYLNNVIFLIKCYLKLLKEIIYSKNLIKAWKEDVIDLINSKQNKSKILSKIHNRIKECIPKCHRPLIWKQVHQIIHIFFYFFCH